MEWRRDGKKHTDSGDRVGLQVKGTAVSRMNSREAHRGPLCSAAQASQCLG